MNKPHPLLLRTAVLLSAFGGVSTAVPLSITTSGVFSTTDTANALATPGGAYTLSFTVDSTPQVLNTGADGFDVPFANFQYGVSGTSESVEPASIRFYNQANLGLFAVFFGPETGIDRNGTLIPEFDFYGDAIYTGSASNPTVLPGIYAVTEAVYSDDSNFDDQFNPGSVVSVSTANGTAATPEPRTWGLSLAGLLAAAFFVRFTRVNASR